jgi:hypothetical protein
MRKLRLFWAFVRSYLFRIFLGELASGAAYGAVIMISSLLTTGNILHLEWLPGSTMFGMIGGALFGSVPGLVSGFLCGIVIGLLTVLYFDPLDNLARYSRIASLIATVITGLVTGIGLQGVLQPVEFLSSITSVLLPALIAAAVAQRVSNHISRRYYTGDLTSPSIELGVSTFIHDTIQ